MLYLRSKNIWIKHIIEGNKSSIFHEWVNEQSWCILFGKPKTKHKISSSLDDKLRWYCFWTEIYERKVEVHMNLFNRNRCKRILGWWRGTIKDWTIKIFDDQWINIKFIKILGSQLFIANSSSIMVLWRCRHAKSFYSPIYSSNYSYTIIVIHLTNCNFTFNKYLNFRLLPKKVEN